MKHFLVKDLLWEVSSLGCNVAQRDPECVEWISSRLTGFSDEFVRKNRLLESYFIKGMNRVFRTTRFELLLKRWVVEYLEKLFRILEDSSKLTLEDNPINRFGIEKYYSRFGVLPEIKWRKQAGLTQKMFSIFIRPLIILYLSLNKGLKISGKRKRYKIMRETIWGLYDARGYYFHDDFIVDGHKIKKEDLLLFFRGVPNDKDRLKAYHDAQRSPYGHFSLQSLSIGIGPLFLRVIPKYIIAGSRILLKEIRSDYFSLYWSIYLYFKYNALPYEKVFSNFELVSEYAHNCFSGSHIPESIVCQNYGVKYYFMIWSDMAIKMNEYMVSYLGCDGYLSWGNAHITGVEGDSEILMMTGFIFKGFIKEVVSNRKRVLSDMGISPRGKIITFFDESFGGEIKMTGEHYTNFWETALMLAEAERENTIVIKPKELSRHNSLSDGLRKRFLDIKNRMEKMPNIYIVDENKWSFIECIGISDIVVTQGMTSSSTIAIICGIEGLYLDEAHYGHPFSKLFKDRLVFDDHRKLVMMISRIIGGNESPLSGIPEDTLRDFDTYKDDNGIDRFRDILLYKI